MAENMRCTVLSILIHRWEVGRRKREEDNIDHRQSTEGRILCLCVKKVVGEESC